MFESNKTLVAQYFQDIYNDGKLWLADTYVTPDYVNHDFPLVQRTPGPEGLKRLVVSIRSAFPDCYFSLERVIATEDQVVVHWSVSGTHRGPMSGIAATGRWVTVSGVSIMHIQAGKFREAWTKWDQLSLLQQLGALPHFNDTPTAAQQPEHKLRLMIGGRARQGA